MTNGAKLTVARGNGSSDVILIVLGVLFLGVIQYQAIIVASNRFACDVSRLFVHIFHVRIEVLFRIGVVLVIHGGRFFFFGVL